MPVLPPEPTEEDRYYLKLVTDFEIHHCYYNNQGQKGCLDEHGKCRRGYTDGILRSTAGNEK